MMPDVREAHHAVRRALELLRVLDREHTNEEMHAVGHAVRYEMRTALEHLPAGVDTPVG
jgi:hypothetical protein